MPDSINNLMDRNTLKRLVLHERDTEKDGGTLFSGENQKSKIRSKVELLRHKWQITPAQRSTGKLP